jgi:hypothetical protein
MTLDERFHSAVRAAHYAVREVPVTHQLQSDTLISGSEPPPRRVTMKAISAVAVLCLVVLAVVGVSAWQMRSPTQDPPAKPTGRVIHPLLLLGKGSFRLDKSAGIARNEANVFFAHWSDLPNGGMYFMRPLWVIDPRTGAYRSTEGGGPSGDGLASWVQANPRLQLGPPSSVTVGGDPAVQFAMHGTHGTTGAYTWMCPDVSHEDCFNAPADGLGYVTIVTHNGSEYVLVGGAETPANQRIAIRRYRQTLRSWTWGE